MRCDHFRLERCRLRHKAAHLQCTGAGNENRHVPFGTRRSRNRQAAEQLLREGESLVSFVEQSIRESIQRRQFQHAFIARGLRSRDEAQRTGTYASAEAVIEKLDIRLAAAKANANK